MVGVRVRRAAEALGDHGRVREEQPRTSGMAPALTVRPTAALMELCNDRKDRILSYVGGRGDTAPLGEPFYDVCTVPSVAFPPPGGAFLTPRFFLSGPQP